MTLKELMRKHKYILQEVSDLSGLSVALLSKINNGSAKISDRSHDKLLKAFPNETEISNELSQEYQLKAINQELRETIDHLYKVNRDLKRQLNRFRSLKFAATRVLQVINEEEEKWLRMKKQQIKTLLRNK